MEGEVVAVKQISMPLIAGAYPPSVVNCPQQITSPLK